MAFLKKFLYAVVVLFSFLYLPQYPTNYMRYIILSSSIIYSILYILNINKIVYSLKYLAQYKPEFILALILSLFTLIGRIYDSTGSISKYFETGISIAHVFIFIFTVFTGLFYILTNYKNIISTTLKIIPHRCKINRISDWLNHTYNIKYLMLFLFISRLLYVLIYFPGNIDADSSGMLLSYYRTCTPYSVELGNMDGNSFLVNHHPILHTILTGTFSYIGSIFNSQNLGILLYVILQIIVINWAIVLLCRKLYAINKKTIIWTNALLLIYAVHPFFSLWSVELAKDQLYSAILLFYVYQLWNVVETNGIYLKSIRNILIHLLVLFLVCLGKNQGIYIIVVCSIILIIVYLKKFVYIAIPYLSCIILFIYVYKGIIFPMFNIAEGGKQEMYGFMFQQTARYIKEYPNDVNNEEKLIINKILPYDKLASLYNPIIQDPVKFSIKVSSSNNHEFKPIMSEYFKVWLNMGLRHPLVYIEATLNTCYGFFYPGHIYERMFHHSKNNLTICKDYPDVFNYHQLKCTYYIQRGIKYLLPILSAIPIVGLFFSLPFFMWIFITSLFLLIKSKRNKDIIIFFPIILSILILFISPANEVYRYIEPIVFTAPFTLIYSIIKTQRYE